MRTVITRYVALGTEIWTDEWRAYRGIPTWGPPGNPYIHRTVNHKQNFVNNGVRVVYKRV